MLAPPGWGRGGTRCILAPPRWRGGVFRYWGIVRGYMGIPPVKRKFPFSDCVKVCRVRQGDLQLLINEGGHPVAPEVETEVEVGTACTPRSRPLLPGHVSWRLWDNFPPSDFSGALLPCGVPGIVLQFGSEVLE